MSTKRAFAATPRAYVFNGQQHLAFPIKASVGAGVASTAIQAYLYVPGYYMISKVGIFASAIDNVTGTDSFNLVVGTTGAYNQNNPTLPDEEFTGGDVITGVQSTNFPTGAGAGYPDSPNNVVATTGQTVFAQDVTFSNAVANAYGTLSPFSGWQLATTTGIYGDFVPTNPTALYVGVPLTLRVTTVASTGSITNLLVVVQLEIFKPLQASAQVGTSPDGILPNGTPPFAGADPAFTPGISF